MFNKGNDLLLYHSARFFQVFASTLVFIDVTKVLKALNVRGSNALLILGRFDEIIVRILLSLHYIAFYLPNVETKEKIVRKIHDLQLLTLLTIYIISLFLAVFCICFIFTRVQDLIEPKRLRMIKVGIFFFPLIACAHCNTFYWIHSMPFKSHLLNNLDKVKFFDEKTKVFKKYELLNLAYMSLWNPFCCYVFFLILYYLNPEEYEENTHDPNNELITFQTLEI